MPRIRGKFAPIFSEIADDERWLMKLDDDGKFLFFLILMTIYQCNNSAPDDIDYYIIRYNLRCSNGELRSRYHRAKEALRRRLDTIKGLFPKLVSNNKKLSLLNYVGYKTMVDTRIEREIEREVEAKRSTTARKTRSNLPDDSWISSLKANPAYKGINVDNELNKMDSWFTLPKAKGRKKTRQFIINWLNKIDKPVEAGSLPWEK